MSVSSPTQTAGFGQYLARLIQMARSLADFDSKEALLVAAVEFVARERPASAVGLWFAAAGSPCVLESHAGQGVFPDALTSDLKSPISLGSALPWPAGLNSLNRRADNQLDAYPLTGPGVNGVLAMVTEGAHWSPHLRLVDELLASMLVGFLSLSHHNDAVLEQAESERWLLYQALMRAPALVFVTRGSKHRFEFINDEFLNAATAYLSSPSGYDRPSVIGLRPTDLFDVDNVDSPFAILDEVYTTGRPFTGKETLLTDRRGVQRYYNHVLQPVLAGDGTVDGILCHAIEVTDEVTARNSAFDVRSRYESIVEDMQGVVWEATANMERFLFVSSRAESITGYPPKSFRQSGFWRSIIYPDDLASLDNSVAQALGAADSVALDYRMVAADGRVLRIHDVVHVYRDVKGQATLLRGLMLDQTEQFEAMMEREQMQLKLLEVQKLESLGVLAGGIAHDFNNLLTGILGNASLIQMDLEEEHPLRSRIDSVVSAANRAADLTRQLLAYSGKGRFVVSAVHLSDQIREIVELLRASVAKKVELSLELDDEVPSIAADSAQLQQVVMNLVINGAEATGSQVGRVLVRTGVITVDEAQPPGLVGQRDLESGRYVFLEVEDNGCGMDQQTRSRIFDPFFTTKPEGRGLGMAAVLGIVWGHSGGIAIDSIVGEGTTFRVYFPATEEELQRDISIPIATVTAGGLVLLIDDEEEVRDAAAAMLAHLGYGVITAVDGKQGIDLFAEFASELHAVILDMTMPGMSGVEVHRELKKLGPDVPVILSSGYDRVEGLQDLGGPALFLRKPYTLKELVRLLPG